MPLGTNLIFNAPLNLILNLGLSYIYIYYIYIIKNIRGEIVKRGDFVTSFFLPLINRKKKRRMTLCR